MQATLLSMQARKYNKRKGVRTDLNFRGNMAHAYFGLSHEVCKRLENMIEKTRKNRSHISREALDAYFLEVNKAPLRVHGSCEKDPIIGLKHIPLTIRKDQSEWMRLMSEKTGKKMSRLGREAIEFYLTQNGF